MNFNLVNRFFNIWWQKIVISQCFQYKGLAQQLLHVYINYSFAIILILPDTRASLRFDAHRSITVYHRSNGHPSPRNPDDGNGAGWRCTFCLDSDFLHWMGSVCYNMTGLARSSDTYTAHICKHSSHCTLPTSTVSPRCARTINWNWPTTTNSNNTGPRANPDPELPRSFIWLTMNLSW